MIGSDDLISFLPFGGPGLLFGRGDDMLCFRGKLNKHVPTETYKIRTIFVLSTGLLGLRGLYKIDGNSNWFYGVP